MKKIIVLVLLLCVAGFAHAEMIVNGDFEDDLNNWSTWGSGSGSGDSGYLWWSGMASIAPSGGSDGGKYAVLDTTDMTGYFESWGWCWQGVWQNDLPFATGQQVTLYGYAKDLLASGATIHLFLEWEDSSGLRVDLDGDGLRGADVDNQDDRTDIPIALVGDGTWEDISTAVTVPQPLGEGIIAQANVMWSIEGELLSIGLDQLSTARDTAINVYPPNEEKYAPTTAVLEWGPPPTFTPDAYDVYLSSTDPNANLPRDMVVDHKDQTTYDPNPDLAYNTKYYWRVNTYDPCDVIRTPGAVWTFTTWPVEPIFSTDVESTSVEAGSAAQFYVETPRSNTFQWYKDGTPDTQVNNGDDGGDISVVSDGTSSTLTINNLEQADEGYYYCVATGNGSTESSHGRLLTKRLMGHWKFNIPPANLLDDEVAGNHGTLTDPNTLNPPPGAPTISQGIEGQAISLGADEIYVDIPNQEYFNFHAQGFTVSAWIKTEQTGWGVVVSKTDRKAPRAGWLLHHDGDTAYINFRENGEVSYNGGLTDNEWHMLAGTYDEQTGMLALYVDGEKRGEDGPIWTLTETDMPLKIGTELSSDYPEPEGDSVIDYEGLIDDVKILSYAQDGYEIATAYTNFVAGASICVEPVPGDQNGDCVINTADLVEVVLEWLECYLVPASACD